MGDEEKRIANAVAKSISKMSEFEKGYILGIAESKVEDKKKKTEDKPKKTG